MQNNSLRNRTRLLLTATRTALQKEAYGGSGPEGEYGLFEPYRQMSPTGIDTKVSLEKTQKIIKRAAEIARQQNTTLDFDWDLTNEDVVKTLGEKAGVQTRGLPWFSPEEVLTLMADLQKRKGTPKTVNELYERVPFAYNIGFKYNTPLTRLKARMQGKKVPVWETPQWETPRSDISMEDLEKLREQHPINKAWKETKES